MRAGTGRALRVPVDGRELRDKADAVGREQDGVQRGDGAAGGEEEVGVVRLFGGQGCGKSVWDS